MPLLKRARSIYDLRPAAPQKVDDLAAFVQMYGIGKHSLSPRVANRSIAQFIAVRACLRMALP